MSRSRLSSGSALTLVLGLAVLALALPRGLRAAPAAPGDASARAARDCLAPIRPAIEDALLGSGFDAAALRRSYLGEDAAGVLDAVDASVDARAELDAICAAFQPAIDERAAALVDALRAAIRAALDGGRVTCSELRASPLEQVQQRADQAARRGELSYYRSLAIDGRSIEVALLGRDAPALAAALRDLRTLQAERNGELARALAAQR